MLENKCLLARAPAAVISAGEKLRQGGREEQGEDGSSSGGPSHPWTEVIHGSIEAACLDSWELQGQSVRCGVGVFRAGVFLGEAVLGSAIPKDSVGTVEAAGLVLLVPRSCYSSAGRWRHTKLSQVAAVLASCGLFQVT